MALQVNLTLNKTFFLPGELVQVSVQISNDADNTGAEQQQAAAGQLSAGAIHIRELSFKASGSERTDPSFIHRLHHPEVRVESTDMRKQVRSIFSTEPAVLVSDQVLAQHAAQHFQLRFRLPHALPPSFRGSAVRFMYLIEVKAVYEVHKGGVEALVYETLASTSFMVWPGSGLGPAGAGAGAPDKRPGSLDATAGGTAPAREPGRGSSAGAPPGMGAAGGSAGPDGTRRQSSAGGAPTSPSAAQVMSPTAGAAAAGGGGGGAAGGGEEAEVGVVDYILGRNNCRIRWQEVSPGQPPYAPRTADGRALPDAATSPAGALLPLASTSSFGSTAPQQQHAPHLPHAQQQHRSMIPFGVNRPFPPAMPHHGSALTSMLPDTDSDLDEQGDAQPAGRQSSEDGGPGGGGRWPGGPPAASPAAAAVAAHQQQHRKTSSSAHIQRQLSTGGAGGSAPGLGGPYARLAGRRGSLFGKVYALNVGDTPLLRLLLQAPLEVPLQPGATFGGVLDFRTPALLAATSGAGGAAGAAGAPSSSGGGAAGGGGSAGSRGGPLVCHDVVVLLESEEVVAPECRHGPQAKRGAAGPSGSEPPYAIRKLHAEHHELCGDLALASFTFSLPATATPSFRTPMVSLRWVLRFELTVGPRLSFAAMDKRARSPRPHFEQLVWSLPLVVRPPVGLAR